jgi:lysophospholipase L1-like esterase
MRILQVLLIATALVTGCDKKPMSTVPRVIKPDTSTTTNPGDKPDANTKLTYLALGDSYTIGQSVEASQNFPNQLAAKLNTMGYKVEAPMIIARTGWTTDELISAIKNSYVTKKFDIVTLLIGVNNQYRGYPVDNYRTEFAELLNTALSYANGKKTRVFVVSIPDYGVTPYAQGSDKAKIAREIDEYNNIAKQTSTAVTFIDITPESRDAANDPALIASDGLHPSAKMYTEWVKLIAPAVDKNLK